MVLNCSALIKEFPRKPDVRQWTCFQAENVKEMYRNASARRGVMWLLAR